MAVRKLTDPTLQKSLTFFLVLLIASLGVVPKGATAQTEEAKRHHALSLIGEPAMGPDFKHFDWVNPNAPKGGTLRLSTYGGFDSLNPFSIKGNAAGAIGLVYDSLMTSNPDEPSAEYGLIAEWVSHPDDYSSATFGLRETARFHDGKPVTPEDVIFSLEALKKAHPHYNTYYRNVGKAEKTGEREVTFTFDKTGNRELPHIMGQLPVLPKHFWQGKDSKGRERNLSNSTLEVPLGSGPYKVKSFEANREIILERVPEYWAKDLPVAIGRYNFDQLKYVYFRDLVPAFEAFKSGQIDVWMENRASAWATQYDFGALKKGQVKKERLSHKRVAGMQAFVFNLRRKKFADPRVRRAFNLAFNFEEANQKLFYGSYVRTASFFENSELAAKGLPKGKELEILNEVKDLVPSEIFTTEYKNPVNKAPTDFRNHLREASKLLEEAGWKKRDEVVEDPNCGFFCGLMKAIGLGSSSSKRVLRNDKGETLDVEFLIGEPTFERVILPYVGDLKKLGINASLRTVDAAQFEKRERTHDFDIVVGNFGQSHSPGNEQRGFWGSAMADNEGTPNTAGIKDPAVDKLVDRIVFAKDREELVAATRALDRVLLGNHYVVPQWYYPYERVATWDKFGRAELLPSQDPTQFLTWWVDPEKESRLAADRKM